MDKGSVYVETQTLGIGEPGLDRCVQWSSPGGPDTRQYDRAAERDSSAADVGRRRTHSVEQRRVLAHAGQPRRRAQARPGRDVPSCQLAQAGARLSRKFADRSGQGPGQRSSVAVRVQRLSVTLLRAICHWRGAPA